MELWEILVALVLLFLLDSGGLGILQMARHAGLPFPFLSLLPIASRYYIAVLAERSYRTRFQKKPLIPFLVLNFAPVPLVALFGLWVECPYSVFLGIPGLILLPIAWEVSYHNILEDYAPEIIKDYHFSATKALREYRELISQARDAVPVSVTGPGEYPEGRPKYDKWHRWNQVPPRQADPGSRPPPGGPED